jgi:hypothetical protein
MNLNKTPLTSKTLWVNLLAVAALLLQYRYGFVLGPEDQLVILAVVNLFLRSITNSPIEWDLPKRKVEDGKGDGA